MQRWEKRHASLIQGYSEQASGILPFTNGSYKMPDRLPTIYLSVDHRGDCFVVHLAAPTMEEVLTTCPKTGHHLLEAHRDMKAMGVTQGAYPFFIVCQGWTMQSFGAVVATNTWLQQQQGVEPDNVEYWKVLFNAN
jgi:hypothetical protein